MSEELAQARVYLAEARRRRVSPHACQRRFAHELLRWAACARLRHMADRIIEAGAVRQPDLFGANSHNGD